jgi:hypothetical protein
MRHSPQDSHPDLAGESVRAIPGALPLINPCSLIF